MLYSIIKRLIEKGRTEGLLAKVEAFYSNSNLTKDEYDEIMPRLLANSTNNG